jgi:flagellar biosynthetic protein FliO
MANGPSFWDVLQYLLSFAFVIALLLALLWGLRKLQNTQAFARKSTARLQILETVSVAPRQKIALVRWDGHEVLVGISAQHMTLLSPPAPPAPASAPAASAPAERPDAP